MIHNNKTLLKWLGLAVILAALIAGLWFWSASPQEMATPQTADSGIILFYGRECPHCKDLEKVLEEQKIAEKVNYDSLEVWHNAENKKVFMDKAFECGIPEDQLGVPFLYARGECRIGTPDIEGFFKQEAGIQ